MSENTLIEGACHCGNIQYHYTINKPLDALSFRYCNCSFCSRYVPIYTSDPDGHLSVSILNPDKISHYQFDTKVVRFLFCANCGNMPLAEFSNDNKKYAVLNIRTSSLDLTHLDIKQLSLSNETILNGQQRRIANWISNIDGL